MRRVIVLERIAGGVRYALWAAVPPAIQAHYRGARASVWGGASEIENRAIARGEVAESVGVLAGYPGTAGRGDLERLWERYQAAVTADSEWVDYGTSWDGATWTAGGS